MVLSLLLQPQTPALWLRVMPGSWSTDGDGGPVPTPSLLPLYAQKLPLVCSASPRYSASALLGWHPPICGRSPGNELPQIVSRYLKPVAGCFPTLGDWMHADGCISPSRLTINKLHLLAHQRCFLQWLVQADLCQLRGSQSLGCTHPSVLSPCSCPDEEEGPFSEAEEEKTRAVRLRDFQGEGGGSQSNLRTHDAALTQRHSPGSPPGPRVALPFCPMRAGHGADPCPHIQDLNCGMARALGQ